MLHWATYIAFTFQEESNLKLLKIAQEELSKVNSLISWHSAEYIHLTVIFLGWLNSDRAKTVNSIIHQHKPSIENLNLSLSGEIKLLGWGKRPEYLTVSLRPEKRLTKLHKSLFQELSQSGIKPKIQDFSPHISLGRIHPDLHIDNIPISNIKIDINPSQLVLLESVPHSRFIS